MSIKQIAYSVAKGIIDSLKGVYWLFNLDSIQRKAHEDRLQFQELKRKPSPIHVNVNRREEPRLLNRVAQCCCLNGLVFGLSILTFNHVVLPCLQVVLAFVFGEDSTTTAWFRLILSWTFGSLWVLPLFLLSRAVNNIWFEDIGSLAYRYSIGRPKGIPSLSNFVADYVFSYIIQALFLIQATLVSQIPLAWVADALYLFHMCLLTSLYAFDYKWVQMGWPLHQRLTHLETNWPYFVGFGLPLTLLTWWPGEFFISGCVFSILFPIFIISGNEAEPDTHASNSRNRDNGVRRLQLFSFVVAISNAFFNKFLKVRKPQVKSNPQHQPQHQQRRRE